MLRYADFLKEAFTQPVPWQWTEKDAVSAYAKFTVDGLDYRVTFDAIDSFVRAGQRKVLQWEFQFRLAQSPSEEKSRYGISGTGHAFTVFATVIDILKAFIKAYNPPEIEFSANTNEPSRVKLYRRFIQQIKNEIPGYVGTESGMGQFGLEFLITKKGRGKG